MELIHTCLMVRDPERSLAFYRTFGFEARFSTGSGPGASIFCGLPGDRERLQLKHEAEPDPAMTRFGHIALEVEDIDAVLAGLAEQDVLPDQPPTAVGSRRICYVHDPDGYAIELIQNTG